MNLKTSNMNNKIVESREIYQCDGDDRYVLVIKKENRVIGLNFMQGCSDKELEFFKRDFNYPDYQITRYYNAISEHLSGKSEIDRINQAIWGWFCYHND